MKETVSTPEPQQQRAVRLCEIPDCEQLARYRGTCSPEHYEERALRRQAALRGFTLAEPTTGGDL
jgi:hypothetical protein